MIYAGHRCLLGLIEYNIQINVGRCLPQMWGFVVGRIKKIPPYFLAGFGKLHISGLDQAKLKRPFDSPPSAVDIEFVVNTLGMGTHRT